VLSGGSILFHSTFSSGTLTLLGSDFSISGMLSNGTASASQIAGTAMCMEIPCSLRLKRAHSS
jgi:hypothetical protein